MSTTSNTPASLWRRLAAMLYDAFLVVALWFVTTTLMVAFLNDGKAIAGPSFQLFLYLEAGAFYAYFWHIKGQTLGMQVWKIRAVSDAGNLLSVGEAIIRFLWATLAMAPFGLGLFWALIDKDRRAAHDIWSHSRVVYLGDKPYSSERS